jgi:L-aminopeptidase/D-esterase-like protein
VITDVPGVKVGHWTDSRARTGCTVVLLPTGTIASGEVRGAAPGTREWALLDPLRTVDRVNAVVLTGGSAFGLAACDGVMRWCEEAGVGWPTPAGPVPIVVGMVLFDLLVGDGSVRPGSAEGYAACAAASSDAPLRGAVGAGAGATVGKHRRPDGIRPAGLGSATERHGGLIVSALMAVNAYGDIRGPGPVVAGTSAGASPGPTEATTIGVIVTNARLSKWQCLLLAQAGHDGLARALEPAHSAFDGDALVAAATGTLDVDADRGTEQVERIRNLAAKAVEAAVRDGAASAQAAPSEDGR